MPRPKPEVNSAGQRELDAAQEKFDKFEQEIKDLTLDRMNEAPKEETEEQTKLSSKEWKEAAEIYLKPNRYIFPSPKPKSGEMVDKFNEKFRAAYEFDKQMVRFIAENNEVIGETITIWTRPYPGLPAEEWLVPTNKPIWGPRYLAEQIKRKTYHRLTMNNDIKIGNDERGNAYTGGIVVDTIKQRLDARSAPKQQFSMNHKVSNF